MTETGVPCPECTNRSLRHSGRISNSPARAVQCSSCGVFYASDDEATSGTESVVHILTPLRLTRSALMAPIENIENRTPQEVFDIMCSRIRAAAGVMK